MFLYVTTVTVSAIETALARIEEPNQTAQPLNSTKLESPQFRPLVGSQNPKYLRVQRLSQGVITKSNNWAKGLKKLGDPVTRPLLGRRRLVSHRQKTFRDPYLKSS